MLFEALIMTLAQEMPVAASSSLVGEQDNRIWRVLHHYVDKAREEADQAEVERIGMDETAEDQSSQGEAPLSLPIRNGFR